MLDPIGQNDLDTWMVVGAPTTESIGLKSFNLDIDQQ